MDIHQLHDSANNHNVDLDNAYECDYAAATFKAMRLFFPAPILSSPLCTFVSIQATPVMAPPHMLCPIGIATPSAEP